MKPKRTLRYSLLFAFVLTCIFFCGCSATSNGGGSSSGELRDNTSKVIRTSADGEEVYSEGVATIDASNKSQGYIMIKYTDKKEQIMIKITDPNGVDYKYVFPHSDKYKVFPLAGGDGTYSVSVLQNIGGDSYIIVCNASVDVKLESEFAPFLSPNLYVNFSKKSETVAKGKELASKATCDLDVVENVYKYVVENIKYDNEKAQSVSSGYIPNVDKTLETKKGICFDYASLMTAMLRSQRIPTKLNVGYAGDIYHAWISIYIDEIGWVDNIIQFDGENWTLMDPTFASSSDKQTMKKLVGDGSNYTMKFNY